MRTTPQDLRALPLLAGLDDEQLGELYAAGEVRPFAAGEELFREHRPSEDWWVLLDGVVTLTRHVGHEETEIGRMSVPGQWAGGFRAWDEYGVYLATGRGAVDGRVLRVPAPALRSLAGSWFPFGVHLIHGLVGSSRRIEGAARQREALVALGTLAAGLAHEINNPASAATRAVDAMEETTVALLSSLGRLAEAHITAAQFVALAELRQELGETPATADP
ncbi:MAG TPA: hypothetical protein VK894_01345, partial [Jiangellales bacterium]|nr:hypothetical protein [Jiangellales bacterium]